MKTKIFILSISLLMWNSDFSISQSNISIRLDPSTGQDCMLASYIANSPLPNYPDIIAGAWTYGGEFNLWRPMFRFNLNEVPGGAIVTNAKLSLYASPGTANQPHTGQNKSFIRKVTTDWDENTVTWETQPEFSTENQVALEESTSPYQDYLDIDVTDLVKDMVRNPSTNFGFMRGALNLIYQNLLSQD